MFGTSIIPRLVRNEMKFVEMRNKIMKIVD